METWEEPWMRLRIDMSTSMYLFFYSATFSLRATKAFLISSEKKSGLMVLMIYTARSTYNEWVTKALYGESEKEWVLTLKRYSRPIGLL